MSIVRGFVGGFLEAVRWRIERYRGHEIADLARLFAALAVVEVLASLVYSIGFVAWAASTADASPTIYEIADVTVWFAGMMLSDVLLVVIGKWGNLVDVGVAILCYTAGVVGLVALGAAVRRWSR